MTGIIKIIVYLPFARIKWNQLKLKIDLITNLSQSLNVSNALYYTITITRQTDSSSYLISPLIVPTGITLSRF